MRNTLEKNSIVAMVRVFCWISFSLFSVMIVACNTKLHYIIVFTMIFGVQYGGQVYFIELIKVNKLHLISH